MNIARDRFRLVHIGALALAAIMLPWSEYLLSIAQFLLIGNWLVEGAVRKDLGGRFKRAFTSPECLVFVSFFGLHALGLLWTDNLGWGMDLCRILLPVLAFAPILASSPRLSPVELRTILLLGAWSTVASTLVCLGLRHEVLGQGGYRELSIFISHIRLALLLCFSAAAFVVLCPRSLWRCVAHGVGAGWCVFFLDRLSSLAGFVILGLMLIYALWRWSRGRSPLIRWSLRGMLLLLPVGAVVYTHWCVRSYYRDDPGELDRLEEFSAGGERYYHDRSKPQRENGHHVWINVADGELERAWARRSQVAYTGTDGKGQPLRWTLMRYMTSMGLRKDSVGALALSAEDVERVEQGLTSVSMGRRDPLRARIDQVLFEIDSYRATGNASGYSVAMRWEFLRAGRNIARAHWLMGVGTGDTPHAFAEEYDRLGSRLTKGYRLRAHNEYLTLLISFGVFGLLWSLFAWGWPAWRLGAFQQPLFVCWLIIFLVSCLSEDTVETQMGATFFAFFYALLVFATPVSVPASQARVAD